MKVYHSLKNQIYCRIIFQKLIAEATDEASSEDLLIFISEDDERKTLMTFKSKLVTS